MRAFFRPNITRAGRIVRALLATVLLVGGFVVNQRIPSILLFISAGFVFFEALRGWCLVRACGIKTKL